MLPFIKVVCGVSVMLLVHIDGQSRMPVACTCVRAHLCFAFAVRMCYISPMRQTFKYKLYRHKRNRKLHWRIEIAGIIYNHCIALHKRYYRWYDTHLSLHRLHKHLTKLKSLPKYASWRLVGSQAIQQIAERIEHSYQRFFDWEFAQYSILRRPENRHHGLSD